LFFLGIDLAWKIKPIASSPAVVLNEEGILCSIASPKTNAEILELVGRYKGCILGIDAPLIVNNISGSRECDLIMVRKYGIPLYQANRTWLMRKYGGIRGEDLSLQLVSLGFSIGPDFKKAQETRAVLEVYPHASLRILLGRVPRYKSGSAQKRKEALREITDSLRQLKPPLDLRPIKQIINADLLDAAVAAHTAYIHWSFPDKTTVVGDARNGFIIIPRPSC
jgi:predicted RNase H-like nuclease